MRSNGLRLTGALAILALTVNQLEPAAFSQNLEIMAGNAPASNVAEVNARAIASPSLIQAARLHSLAEPPQARPAMVSKPSQTPSKVTPVQKKRNGLKWAIVIAAAGAGVAAFALTKGNSPPSPQPIPTIPFREAPTFQPPNVVSDDGCPGCWDY